MAPRFLTIPGSPNSSRYVSCNVASASSCTNYNAKVEGPETFPHSVSPITSSPPKPTTWILSATPYPTSIYTLSFCSVPLLTNRLDSPKFTLKSTDSEPSSNTSSTPTGSVVGIAIGLTLGFLALFAVCYVYYLRLRQARRARRRRHGRRRKKRGFVSGGEFLYFPFFCGLGMEIGDGG